MSNSLPAHALPTGARRRRQLLSALCAAGLLPAVPACSGHVTEPTTSVAKPRGTLAAPLCASADRAGQSVHLSVPAGFVQGAVQGPKSQAAFRYDLDPRSASWSTVAVYRWTESNSAADRDVLDQLASRFGAETSALVAAADRPKRGAVKLADGSSAPAWSFTQTKPAAEGDPLHSYTMWLFSAGSQRFGIGVQTPKGTDGEAVRKAVLASLASGACAG